MKYHLEGRWIEDCKCIMAAGDSLESIELLPKLTYPKSLLFWCMHDSRDLENNLIRKALNNPSQHTHIHGRVKKRVKGHNAPFPLFRDVEI